MRAISKRDQEDDDTSMEDVGIETISGLADVVHKAQDERMDAAAAASTNKDLENNNNGCDAKDELTNKFTNDDQSNATRKSANPVIDINNDADIWDGTTGESPEESTSKNIIVKLQDENLALKDQVARLKNEIGILKGEKNNIINSAHTATRELRTIITNQHGALDNANNRITTERNRNLGQRHQLDSLYATLARQRDLLNAQAAYIHVHDEKVRRIKLEVNKMVRTAVQRFGRQASANVSAARRFAAEVDRVIFNQLEDPEATEDENEAGAGEDQEVEIINLIDEDDNDGNGDQTAGNQVVDVVQPAVIEQLDQVQQVVDDEDDTAIQQPGIIEQQMDDTTQVDPSEESPRKRIRMT